MEEEKRINPENLENVSGGVLGKENPKIPYPLCPVCGKRMGLLSMDNRADYICANQECSNYFFKDML